MFVNRVLPCDSQAIIGDDGRLIQDISDVRALRGVSRFKERVRVFSELVWKSRVLKDDGFVREALKSMGPQAMSLLQLAEAKDFVEWAGFKKVWPTYFSLPRSSLFFSQSLKLNMSLSSQVVSCKSASQDASRFNTDVIKDNKLSDMQMWQLLAWYFCLLRHALTHERSASLVS